MLFVPLLGLAVARVGVFARRFAVAVAEEVIVDDPSCDRRRERYLLTPEQWDEQETKRKPAPPVATPTNTE